MKGKVNSERKERNITGDKKRQREVQSGKRKIEKGKRRTRKIESVDRRKEKWMWRIKNI